MENENYKWKAVKQFQDNWDVNASDFSEMLSRSLEKTYNLLASANNFPKGMMSEFAKAAPEEVRAMFIALFDESRDVFERMDEFKHQSSVLLENTETERRSTTSMKMLSAHTFGCAIRTSTISINSAKLKPSRASLNLIINSEKALMRKTFVIFESL